MVEGNQIVLGIDLCEDITQVTIMRPYAAEPDAVKFDEINRREFLPTRLVKSEKGEWNLEENAEKAQIEGVSFYDAAVGGRKIKYRDAEYDAFDLLESFLLLLLKNIGERYKGFEIGFLTVVCERPKQKGLNSVEVIRKALERLGLSTERALVVKHSEAALHYAIHQEESLWKNGSAVFDYTAEGLRFYSIECRISAGKRLLLTNFRDYSEEMPTGAVNENDAEATALLFERLAERALEHKPATLYITGRGFEGEWAKESFRRLSLGRRVFRGQNLYTQGACYISAEHFFGDGVPDFDIFYPNQIRYDVYLQAESADDSEIALAKAGSVYSEISTEVTVLLDTIDRLTFRITPVGSTKNSLIKATPGKLAMRSDRTNRYLVRVFFVTVDRMVIQMKEVGFGDFYPATDRIFEEIVDLSQFEE